MSFLLCKIKNNIFTNLIIHTSTCIYKFELHTDQINNQPFKLNTHDSNKPMTVI